MDIPSDTEGRLLSHAIEYELKKHGGDPAAQQLLGYASIITTEIYTHVGTRRLKTVHANTHPRGRVTTFSQ
jgi:site-specific recombinase XerD